MAKEGIQNYPQVQLNFLPKVPPLKKIKDKTKVNVRYAVIAPYAFIHIYWDPKLFEIIYEVEEPFLDETEQAYRDQIIEAMRNMIIIVATITDKPFLFFIPILTNQNFPSESIVANMSLLSASRASS